ncbi:hypothetical protein MGALJ_39550 [Mycobacterium gallinarum]|uniref:Uncharacterized protein n=1 Tax=Mycobacterium gallinarum TaxID=39689 RepID=A0A9W4FGQ8_9MYCO|nr:AAA family ATPase [Mycobacterium gallinarum]BBY94286.1 hypothetical protein MGALJ_39550 [Mycobacterium gallinarum]
MNHTVLEHVRTLAKRTRNENGYKNQFLELAENFRPHLGNNPDEVLDQIWHEVWASKGGEQPVVMATPAPDESATVNDRADQLEFEFKAEAIARKRVQNLGVQAALSKLPDVLTYEELQEAAKDVPKHRITNLLPDHGNMTVVGGNKCGKTERTLELIKSLVTGEPYLGEFEVVDPLNGKVLFLNYELTPALLAEWMRDMGLDSDKVLTMHLRDYASVPLLSDGGAEWLVNVCLMHDVETLALDPGGRAMTAAGCKNEDSNDEVKVITSHLDQIKAEAGMSHLVIPLHANRVTTPVRPRGADSWGGWHDASISLWLKNANKPYAARMFSAHGRDVSMPETELIRDDSTRLCRLKERGALTEDDIADAGDPPKAAATRKRGRQPVSDDEIERRVERYMTEHPDASEAQCERGVTGGAARVRKAYRAWVIKGAGDDEV